MGDEKREYSDFTIMENEFKTLASEIKLIEMTVDDILYGCLGSLKPEGSVAEVLEKGVNRVIVLTDSIRYSTSVCADIKLLLGKIIDILGSRGETGKIEKKCE